MQQKFSLHDVYSFPKTMFLSYAEKYGIDIYADHWEIPPELEKILKKQTLTEQTSSYGVEPKFYTNRPQEWIKQEQHYRYIYHLENRSTYRKHEWNTFFILHVIKSRARMYPGL